MKLGRLNKQHSKSKLYNKLEFLLINIKTYEYLHWSELMNTYIDLQNHLVNRGHPVSEISSQI